MHGTGGVRGHDAAVAGVPVGGCIVEQGAESGLDLGHHSRVEGGAHRQHADLRSHALGQVLVALSCRLDGPGFTADDHLVGVVVRHIHLKAFQALAEQGDVLG